MNTGADMTAAHFDQGLIESVMNTISDGVTMVDRDLRIIYENTIMQQFYGAGIGEKCFVAYRRRTEPCADCLILQVLQDGVPRSGVHDIRLPNGSVLMIEFKSLPIKDNQGAITGAVEIMKDVTQQMRVNLECCTLRREIARQGEFENIITQSKKIKNIFRLIERVAATTSSVFISGESGTGKELIAKAIFANSDRRDKPFVSLNCGAIPENLLESELFGHVKGAFTGAIRDHIGLIETANQGTIFLDEVGEIPSSLQVKLLRFLQEGETRRVGDTRVRKYDVRVISATNRNLEQAVRDGVFREDLYFRLNVIPITLPSLRERTEDIIPLANHFMQRLCDEHKREVSGISSRALKALLDYPWPGNIRELENTIEYAIHLTEEGQPIRITQLPPKITGIHEVTEKSHPHLSIEGYIKQTILSLQADHNEDEISAILGISRKNLWEKRKRLDVVRADRPR
jgi:transcriptional regulator with PAS, ATPase and Fis domain